MEVLKRFRDRRLAGRIVSKIRGLAARIGDRLTIMGFCGTHEYTIVYYGIRSLMPSNVELIAGPGCPVCIVPAWLVDSAVELALDGVTVYTYGDMYRVPGSRMSLAEARAAGGSVKVVYSFLDAVKAYRGGDAVFFGVGFETTQPTVAARIVAGLAPEGLKILPAYRLTPPVMKYVLEQGEVGVNAVIAPGHVSSIIGSRSWAFLPEEYSVPTVVAGFEPLDVLIAVLRLIEQAVKGRAELVNEYSRVVTPEGNRLALNYIEKVFERIEADWRGLGVIPSSGLAFRNEFSTYDALRAYGLRPRPSTDFKPGCRCRDVILGVAKPTECKLFMKACTPTRPQGPCMVSSEGTCAIWARFGAQKR